MYVKYMVVVDAVKINAKEISVIFADLRISTNW